MSNKKIKICMVQPESIAEEAGIEAGDRLLSINEKTIKDIFDYRYYQASEELLLEIEKPDGEIWEIEVEKDENEELGLEFEDSLIDGAKSCTNKCIFCFIDQLPKGMRETVYFKDDDSRLSFLTGNYVTLTNIKNEELKRIIHYRMSPINVSVHTTNPDLRKLMLGNRFAGDVLNKIKMLTDNGIEVNCQIVLCRDINDKDELDRTIGDLAEFAPGVSSVSIVPVGISRHRENLFELIPFDKESSTEVIKQVHNWQNKLLKDKGSRLIYLSDEFYINADVDLPKYKDYEDFPQIENGVGMVASLKKEVIDTLKHKKGTLPGKRHISIATGRLVNKIIIKLVEEIKTKYEGLEVNVYAVENNFFGPNVTVCGLLTGQDIAEQLNGKELGQELLISRSMLRAGEHVLLDDYTVEQLEDGLKVKIRIVDSSGEDFVNALIGK
ncbi:MAG: Fe-S oxidoreductase [Eubacterium sp.]|nr:Fe-S oxidoreductase [Eubacterium sp.]